MFMHRYQHRATLENSPAAAPASESRERRLKAVVEHEHDEDDEDDEDEPPSSERVRRAGGMGSQGLGKS